MARAKAVRLADGTVVRPPRPRSAEFREPLERSVARSMMAGVPVEIDGRRRFQLGWKPLCANPYHWLAYGSASEHIAGRKRNPIFVHGFGRCRQCEHCKKARSAMWQIRAMTEFAKWPVTLFGTITMSLEEHYALDARIICGTPRPGGWIRHPANINDMSPSELFDARVKAMGDETQKFLKRLRKGDSSHKPQIRYLLVAEAHDSEKTDPALRNRPHFHLLLHETVKGSLVHGEPTEAIVVGQSGEYWTRRYKSGKEWRNGVFVKDDAFLRTQWHFGFTKFQLAENARAASYLCKYLNKASDCRIRASLGYGISDEITQTDFSKQNLNAA